MVGDTFNNSSFACLNVKRELGSDDFMICSICEKILSVLA